MNRAEQKQYLIDNVNHPTDINDKSQMIDYLLDDLDGKAFDISKVVKELNEHRPIQYISNVAHFYGYKFYVDERVLIPRPETEELVYETVKTLKKEKNYTDILDIGTGSGVIPITTKLEYSNVNVSAVDVSEDALEVAKINAKQLDASINFMHVDILNDDACKQLDKYDIIISNPPYIPHKEKALMSKNVLDYEPDLALFVEDHDPLLFYRRITQLAKELLRPKGIILFEINEYYSDKMIQMVNYEKGFCTVIKDLQGKDRMMKIWF